MSKKHLQELIDALAEWYDHCNIGPAYGSLLTESDKGIGQLIQAARSDIPAC